MDTSTHATAWRLNPDPAPAFDDGVVGLLVGVVAGATDGDAADGPGLLVVGLATFGAAGCAVVVVELLHLDGSARASIPVNGVGDEPKELN